MYTCPICNNPGIPKWRKLFMSPLIPAKCRHCGKMVVISGKGSFRATIPLIIAVVIIFNSPSMNPQLKLLILFSGIFLNLFFWIKFASLVPKEDDVITEVGEKGELLRKQSKIHKILLLIIVFFLFFGLLSIRYDSVYYEISLILFILVAALSSLYFAYLSHFLNIDILGGEQITLNLHFRKSKEKKNIHTGVMLAIGIFFVFLTVMMILVALNIVD